MKNESHFIVITSCPSHLETFDEGLHNDFFRKVLEMMSEFLRVLKNMALVIGPPGFVVASRRRGNPGGCALNLWITSRSSQRQYWQIDDRSQEYKGVINE